MGLLYEAIRTPARRLIQSATQRVHYPAFHWIVQWDLTYRCNLNCSYCQRNTAMREVDPKEVYPLIRTMRPKHLILTGGEPLLYEGLEDLVIAIRQELNPHLVLNTNLVARTANIERFFQHFNVVHFSFDGVDEFNVANRGCSGRGVYRNFERLVRIQREEGYESPHWVALCMVTTENWRNAPDVIEPLTSLSPTVQVGFATVEPQTHPLSLTTRKDILSGFGDRLFPLIDRNPGRVVVVGPLAQGLSDVRPAVKQVAPGGGAWKNHGRLSSCAVNCWRQFFRTVVPPDGTVWHCKPELVRRYLGQTIRREVEQKRPGAVLEAMKELVRILLVDRSDPTCFVPCKCEEYLEDVLRTGDDDPLPRSCLMLAGKFSDEEVEAADRFVRRHLGHGLSPGLCDVLTGKTPTEEIARRFGDENSPEPVLTAGSHE